jgi:hypothetical protein
MDVPLVRRDIPYSHIEWIYWYYYHRGFQWILISQVYHIIGYIFIYTLLIAGLFFINWEYLGSNRDLSSVFTVGDTNMLWLKVVVSVISFIIMVVKMVQSVYILVIYYRISKLVNRYNIDINRPWSDVVTSLITLFGIDILEVHQLVMRKDNIVLSFFHQLYPRVIPNWYTIAFEWILNTSVWSYLIDLNRPIVNCNHVKSILRRRVVICCLLYLLISPFVVMYIVGYYIVNYLEQIRQHPLWLFQRRWNRLAYCCLRYYNELLHLFERRLEGSQENVDNILKLTPPNPVVVLITRLIRLVVGTLLTVLLVIGIVNSDVITSSSIYGYPLLSLMGILGLIFFIPDWVGRITKVHHIQDIDENLRDIESRLGINTVDTIRSMYQYRLIVFIVEVISISLSPIYLLLNYRNITNCIVDFFIEHTEFNERFSRYFCVDSTFRSVDMDSDGKVYLSVLEFSNNNPEWK